jgi:RNA polymerase sigma-70 factor (ECF subfamily)
VDQAGTAAGSEMAVDGDRDEQLALAARTDKAAFEMLYLRHRLAVFRYLRSRSRTDDEAADLTATTFERALSAIARYRTKGGGVLAWLFRIARNAAIDARRRDEPVTLEGMFGLFASDATGPDGIASEDRRELLGEIARLPELQREALALRFAGGLTAREIAVVIGKSEAAAQKLLSRSIETLREAYRVNG